MIYSAENGGWAKSVTVIPALVSLTITEDGTPEAVTPLGMASSKRLTTNTGWIDHQKWDWGIIDLDKSFDTWQLFEVGSIATTKEVMSIGYPFDDKDFCMNYDVGNLISSSYEDFNFSNTIATGDSGGALIDTKTWKLIAILSKTAYNGVTGEVLYNNSVRINPDLYNRFVMHQNELKEEGY